MRFARSMNGCIRHCVLAAYGGRCAISHLPREQLGQPVISNGLPLTKIHHAAFDAHLIGVDPDFRAKSLSGCSISSALTERYRLERS